MIRLQRVGRVNDSSFRVVVTDKRNATKSGRFLEILGSYNARFGKAELKRDRVEHWMKNGVQLTATVHNLFANHKLIQKKKHTFANKPKKVEAAPAAEVAPAPAVVEEASVPEAPAETASA